MSLSITQAVEAAAPGPLLVAELVPLSGSGKVRATYNWLYSALNCDSTDSSPFAWVLIKNENGTVALSPQQPYEGMTLYASVRPDNSYYVQVQAPYSADWITKVAGDEEMHMVELGLRTIELLGVNNQWVSVDGTISSHDWHAGYQLQGTTAPTSPLRQFFLAVKQVLQEQVSVALFSSLSAADVCAELAGLGVPDPEQSANLIFSAVQQPQSTQTR